jgi:hypothetical protein
MSTDTLPAAPRGGGSCATTVSVSDEVLEGLEQGDIAPYQVTLCFRGMIADVGSDWDEGLRDRLAKRGQLALPVRRFFWPHDVWFNIATKRSAEDALRLMREIQDTRRMSGASTPVAFNAVGFSAGSEVILELLDLLAELPRDEREDLRLRRAVLMHSSSFAWSGELTDAFESGVLESAIHYWSPIDLTTLLAPAGAGQFGMRRVDGPLENRVHFMPHLAHLIEYSLLDDVEADLPAAEGRETDGTDERFRVALTEYLRNLPERENR